MNIFNRLFRHHQKRSLSLSSTGFSPFFVTGNGTTIAPRTVTPSMALTNSDVYAVVSRIASNIAAMPMKTTNPTLQKTLSQPSPYINGFSFWQKVLVQMLLTGNSYVAIKRDGNMQPKELVQIPANQVQITLLSKKSGDKADGMVYTVTITEENSEQINLPASDVLHFRCLVSGSDAQTNGYCGVSPLVSLAQEVAIQDQSNTLAISSLKHAIAPTYALKIPGAQVDNDDKDNMRNNFEASISGANQGRPIILDQSMDVAPLQISPDIDKLLSNARYSQDQIAKAFGIPVEYLNGQGDQQSSIQMMSSLYVNALSAYIHPILSELSLKFGTDVRADFSSLADVDHSQLISQVVSLAAGKTSVLPAKIAVQILRDHDALGLADIPADDLTAALEASASQPTATQQPAESDQKAGSSPPTPQKGDENDENDEKP